MTIWDLLRRLDAALTPEFPVVDTYSDHIVIVDADGAEFEVTAREMPA